MVHIRETRGCALEIKFVIDAALGGKIGSWARAHLRPDPHGVGPFGDEYEIASLYFDTSRYDVFHRNGSFGRAKYRVRRYGSGDEVFLERKLRREAILIKRRSIAPLSDLGRLEDVQTFDGMESFQGAESHGAWGGEWFHRRLRLRRLQPVCQVSYRRIARIIEQPEGLARLTLDADLRAATIARPAFTTDGGLPFLDDRMILELKYRAQLPAIFKRVVEEFALAPRAASKYRLASAALGHVTALEDRSAGAYA